MKTAKKAIITAVVVVLLFGAVGSYLYVNHTEVGRRQFKNFSSNFTGGLNRHVYILDKDGKIVWERKGKFDVVNDNGNISYVESTTGKKTMLVVGDNETLIIEELD
ncbi:hypothetical protein [Mycoplasma sp. P36-A1]|uniref:hypothetical protein n=1 Tax=Mycoplasma sp. P36-A1 TaxID=3252900 RepID=UPI003C2FF139